MFLVWSCSKNIASIQNWNVSTSWQIKKKKENSRSEEEELNSSETSCDNYGGEIKKNEMPRTIIFKKIYISSNS
jgi:hypothetical protein